MEIDFTILEKIRQYYAGELDASAASQVESLMDNDEQYAYHNQIFHSMEKDIRASGAVSTIHESLIPLDEEEKNKAIEKLVRADKSSSWWRRILFFLPILVLLAFGIYRATMMSEDEVIKESNAPDTSVPIAEESGS